MATNHEIRISEIINGSCNTYSVKDDSPRGVHTAYKDEIKVGDEVVINNYFTTVIDDPKKDTTTTDTTKASEEATTKTITTGVVSVSPGNSKTGLIPSVSLPAVKTCAAGVPCIKKCYAAKLERIRKNVRDAYARNLEILNDNPASFWLQVRAAASTARFFRYHVSGDILNPEYFAEMVKTAEMLPITVFMCFTKKYNIINDYIKNGGKIPENLKVIFSEWGDGWEVPNPYNLPTSRVIFKGEDIPENVKVCGGNCAECACRGVGCWELKNGETIAFYEH